jgi:chromosome segregation ATPase
VRQLRDKRDVLEAEIAVARKTGHHASAQLEGARAELAQTLEQLRAAEAREKTITEQLRAAQAHEGIIAAEKDAARRRAEDAKAAEAVATANALKIEAKLAELVKADENARASAQTANVQAQQLQSQAATLESQLKEAEEQAAHAHWNAGAAATEEAIAAAKMTADQVAHLRSEVASTNAAVAKANQIALRLQSDLVTHETALKDFMAKAESKVAAEARAKVQAEIRAHKEAARSVELEKKLKEAEKQAAVATAKTWAADLVEEPKPEVRHYGTYANSLHSGHDNSMSAHAKR